MPVKNTEMPFQNPEMPIIIYNTITNVIYYLLYNINRKNIKLYKIIDRCPHLQ